MRIAFSSALIAGLAAASSLDVPEFTGDWEQNHQIGFTYCDADRNGSIDFWELKYCVKRIGSNREWSDEEIEKEWQAHDINDDQKVEFWESRFLSDRRYNRPDNSNNTIDDDLAWIDTDNSGDISW